MFVWHDWKHISPCVGVLWCFFPPTIQQPHTYNDMEVSILLHYVLIWLFSVCEIRCDHLFSSNRVWLTIFVVVVFCVCFFNNFSLPLMLCFKCTSLPHLVSSVLMFNLEHGIYLEVSPQDNRILFSRQIMQNLQSDLIQAFDDSEFSFFSCFFNHSNGNSSSAICQSHSLASFKTNLKTHLFVECFHHSQ